MTRGERLAADVAEGVARLKRAGQPLEVKASSAAGAVDRETAEMRAKRRVAVARLKTFRD
jgi:hypothetical protein